MSLLQGLQGRGWRGMPVGLGRRPGGAVAGVAAGAVIALRWGWGRMLLVDAAGGGGGGGEVVVVHR